MSVSHAAPAALPHVYSDAERRMALVAVLIVLFLSALDQTIVATAMPRIINDLAGLERIAWVGTAYLLTSTVTVPIYGKLGDIHGRRPVIIFGVLVFLAGSMLCGLAGEFGDLPIIGDGMNQLVAWRAVQGLGAGALTTGAFATVADIAPPAERGRYTGWFGAMFGLAGLAGPVLGGVLTDHATMTVLGHVIAGWRFIFYVNLPLGLVALYILLRHLPPGNRGQDTPIDWLGSALVVTAAVPLLLALSWAGEAAGWQQPRVGIALGVAAAGLAAYLVTARGKAHAVVPLDLFADKVVTRAIIALFLINLAYMSVPMFLPLYLQLVRGLSAAQSGAAMLPLLFGILAGSMLSGRSGRKSQQYKPALVAGGAVALAGMAAITQLSADISHGGLMAMLFVFGLGLGPAQGMFTLAVQSAVSHARVGVATASSQFFRQIGSTIGMALYGGLMVFHLTGALAQNVPALVQGQSITLAQAQTLAMDKTALAKAAPVATDAAEAGLKASFSDSITALFPVSLAIMLLAFAVTLAVPARKLRGRDDVAPA
ncbi:MDR family MFS transporter [Sandarakinorhabdus sp.]|uniref:MDR family MFS transporter n=1 Tax=Sandarakinorhabdus sp. TaxID=1916663 RepID=UPI00286E9B0F|nr:MDR family MFS transporter [Sandarakinorhabdus sp.]